MKRLTKRLPVPLTETERQEMSAELIKGIETRVELDAEKRASAKDYTERVSHADVTIRNLAATLRRGTVIRDVECSEQRSWSTREMLVVREDTGEVVERRTMTAEEAQMEFPAPADGERTPV